MTLSQNNAKNGELTERQVLKDICAFFRQSDGYGEFSEPEIQRFNSYPNCKLRVAFAGQTKSGKSTLLNAILNEQLLASSTLQCSSEIVNIGYGERYEKSIQFADGGAPYTETYSNARQLAMAIQAHISIPDSHRNIPHTLIDHDILVGQANADNDGYIQQLEQRSGTILGDELATIKSYIASRKKSDIPLSINISTPRFPYRELVFQDSPGFNALGGLHEKNIGLFAQADIVVLVHSLVSPIEHAELRNLVQRALESHQPSNVFLVLTQASRVTALEIQRKFEDAVRMYGSSIYQENILAVDSLAFVTLKELNRANDTEKLMRSYKIAIKALESMDCSARKHDAHAMRQRLNLLRELEETGNGADISRALLRASGMDMFFFALEAINSTAKIRTVQMIKMSLANDVRSTENSSLLARYESEEARKYALLVDLMSKSETTRYSLLIDCKNNLGGLRGALKSLNWTDVRSLFSETRTLQNLLSVNVDLYRVSIAQTRNGISQIESSGCDAAISSEAYRNTLDNAVEICALRDREAVRLADSILNAMPVSVFSVIKLVVRSFQKRRQLRQAINTKKMFLISSAICMALVFAIWGVYPSLILGALIIILVVFSCVIDILRYNVDVIDEFLESNINRKKISPLTFSSCVEQKYILQRIKEYS